MLRERPRRCAENALHSEITYPSGGGVAPYPLHLFEIKFGEWAPRNKRFFILLVKFVSFCNRHCRIVHEF